MKLKLVLLTLAAVVAAGYQAQAFVLLTTTNNSKLNVSATIITNGAYSNNGNVSKYPIGTSKIGNKQVLDLFAHWIDADRTVEPWSKAQLVVGWDSGSFGGGWGDILVVDKTGTNVLFNASADGGDYDPGSYWMVIDFFSEGGAYQGEWSDGDPGSGHFRTWNEAYIEIFDYNWYLPYTDLWAYGGSVQNSSEVWDINDDPKSWTDSENADFSFTGDQYFMNVGSGATFSGRADANGHGKGWSPFAE